MYLDIPYKLFYDTNVYKFKKIIKKIFNVNCLFDLHRLKHYDLLKREKDQSTIWHEKYYDQFDIEFKKTYIDLIYFLKQSFGYKQIIYQKIPTLRVHLANGNIAVGDWHKDKNYNHGISEVNFWLPFVDTNNLNSIWIESKEDLGDHKPYKVKYGEILVFNGANLNHGNKKNTSTKTRVSVDFRLIDPKKFVPNEKRSINTNSKFDIGDYFDQI